jgi:radical SAM protein with 4Fe4S-binding SPASM domain
VTLRVTDRCNYECVHCYQEHERKPELSFEEIHKLLVEIADAGALFIVLMGGEFFMRRDADEILTAAHELGFAIRLKTTGHHVTEQRADFLLSVRPLEVDLSLYGAHPHVHEEVTVQPGSWERTIAAARRLVARKIPVVLRCPVMQSNAGEIEDLRRLAAELGAPISFDGKILARENADLEPTTMRMDEPTLRSFYRDSMAGFLAEHYAQYDGCSKTRDGQEVNALSWSPCGAGQRSVTIDPQGVVWPCNLLRVPVGDARADGFRKVWSGSETLAEIRDIRWASISECNVCELRPYCSRCHAMADLEHGDRRGPSLEACRHAVEVRDALRAQGKVPASDTSMPPTWDRIDPDGQHQERIAGRRRPAALRVLP